jgi:hypothetical protein
LAEAGARRAAATQEAATTATAALNARIKAERAWNEITQAKAAVAGIRLAAHVAEQ